MSRSRFGGFRKGRKRYFNNWSILKSEDVAVPETVADLDYSKAKGIWNLKSTTQFPKAQGPTNFTFVASSTSADSATITIPASAQAGDIAVLFDSTATDSTVTPSGWTSIYQQSLVFETSISYKILQSGDASSSVTGQTNTTYSVKIMLVFRPNATINSVSVNDAYFAGETASTPGAITTTPTSTPNIVLGMARAYQATPFVNETFWDDEVLQTEGNGNRMKVYYEIQSAISSRTLTTSADYGSYNFAFICNLTAS